MKYLDISISILVIGIVIISVINYFKKIKETFDVINKCSELNRCKKIELPELQNSIVTKKPTTTTTATTTTTSTKTDDENKKCNDCVFPHYSVDIISKNNICKALKIQKL